MFLNPVRFEVKISFLLNKNDFQQERKTFKRKMEKMHPCKGGIILNDVDTKKLAAFVSQVLNVNFVL